MTRFFPDDHLRRLRNQVPFPRLFAALRWTHNRRGDQWAFLCPLCGETQSAVNPRTNLARCFHCETNFNPIDFTMAVQRCSFVDAVHYVELHLRRDDPRSGP